MLIRNGPFHFGDRSAAMVVVLHRGGDLETVVHHPDYDRDEQRRLKWGTTETIAFVRGGSRLYSEGKGRMHCLAFGYQPPPEPKDPGTT